MNGDKKMSEIDVIRDKLIDVMNSCGFDVSTDTLDASIEYDSLQFVSTMVELENAFQIQIPDEYLLAEGLDTPYDILNMVLKIIKS